MEAKQNCPTISIEVAQQQKIFKDIIQYFCSIRYCKIRFLWNQAWLRTDRKADIQSDKTTQQNQRVLGTAQSVNLWPESGLWGKVEALTCIQYVCFAQVGFFCVGCRKATYLSQPGLLSAFSLLGGERGDCSGGCGSGRAQCACSAVGPEGPQKRVYS